MAQRWIHWWFSAPSSSVSRVILTVLPQWPCLFLLSCWLSDIEKRFNWKVLNAAAATALWESRVLQLMRVFTSRLWFYGKCSVCGSWCETSAERLGDHFEKRKSTNKQKIIKAAFSKIYYNRTGTSLRRRVYLFICLYSCYFLTEVNHLMRPLTPDVLLLTDTVVRQCDWTMVEPFSHRATSMLFIISVLCYNK